MERSHRGRVRTLGKRVVLNGARGFESPPLLLEIDKRGSLSTVVGDEKLTSREDLIGLLFFYVQSDEDTFLKVDEVSKTESQPFDVFNQLVSRF